MKHLKAFVAAFYLISTVVRAKAKPLKNIVFVHGAWVDTSGWNPRYDILTKEGETFADDVTATRRILDLQDGPILLVGTATGDRSPPKPAFIRRP
jgi:hypothetical protein